MIDLKNIDNIYIAPGYTDMQKSIDYKLLPNDSSRKTSDEAKSIIKYDRIFHKENEIREKANKQNLKGEKRKEYIYKRRQKEVKPLFDEFLVWLKTIREKILEDIQ